MGILCRPLRLIALLIAGLLAGACNSGSSSSPSSASSDTPPPPTGQALLGPLINAKVEVFSLTALDGAPIFTTTTADNADLDQAGRFVIPTSSLDDNALYIVKVSGGQDIDVDDVGVRDAAPTENKGAIHAVLTGQQIRSGGYHVSILTEVLYRRLAYLLSAGYTTEDILNELDYRAAIALQSDINGDGKVDRNDVAAWQPRLHRAALRHGYAVYQHLQDLIHRGTALDAQSLYPTDRLIGALDLSGTTVTTSAFANGIAGFLSPTPSAYKLQIIDLAEPSRPRLAGSLETDFSGGSIAAQGPYFYVTNGTNLFVIDAGNKDSPAQVGNLVLPAPQDFQWISVSGNFAYLTSSSSSGCSLIIVDISHPEAPRLRGTVTCTGSLGHSYYSNGLIYVPNDNTVQIFDVHSPDSPVAAGSIDLVVSGNIYATANTAYVPDIYSRLNIVDVTNIYSPSIIRTIDPSDYVPIGLEENRLFADDGISLQIYDISAPASPSLLFTIPTLSSAPIYYSDEFAYQYAANQLMVLDLHDLQASPNPKHAHLATAPALDLTVDHDRAYLSGIGKGLFVADISDPGAPKQTGTIETPGFAFKAALTNGRIYTNGLFDVTQIDITTTPGIITGNADRPFGTALAIGGNSLYSLAPGVLRAFDITQADSLTPREGSNIRKSALSSSSDLSLNDAATLGCATGADGSLRFIDTATLEIIKALPLTSTPVTCRFHGSLVFVTTEDDIEIIDASNPAAAAVVAHIAVQASSPFLFNGDIAYVSDVGSDLIYIYDVSDPTHPALMNSVSGYLNQYTVLRGSEIYAGNEIWDISDALHPTTAGSFALDGGDFVRGLALSGSWAYLLAQNSPTQAVSLYIVDITDPAAPIVTSKTEIPLHASIVSPPPQPFPTSIAVQNDTAYISGYEMGVLTYDVQDSLNPRLIDSRFNPIYIIADVAAMGNYAYVSDYVYGFHVLDFTDPLNPTYHDISGTTGTPDVLAVQNNMLYAVNNSELQVIDISDPVHASLTGSVNLNFTIGGCKVAVAGAYAYVVGENELRVIDVSDPAHPSLVGPAVQLAYYQFLNSRSITVAGDKLYVARGAAGVEVIDISSPTHPFSAAIIPVPAMAPVAAGDYLYLAGENGLDIVKPMARTLP